MDVGLVCFNAGFWRPADIKGRPSRSEQISQADIAGNRPQSDSIGLCRTLSDWSAFVFSTIFASKYCKQSDAIGLNRTLSDSVGLVGLCVLNSFCKQILQAVGRNRTQSDSVGLYRTGRTSHSAQFWRMKLNSGGLTPFGPLKF